MKGRCIQQGPFMELSVASMDTIYFYNGKMFGLRGGEHWKMCVNNFSFGPNVINFEENVYKTFHGGITDLKY